MWHCLHKSTNPLTFILWDVGGIVVCGIIETHSWDEHDVFATQKTFLYQKTQILRESHCFSIKSKTLKKIKHGTKKSNTLSTDQYLLAKSSQSKT